MSVRTVIADTSGPTTGVDMYLVDTDIISEIRNGDKADPGVRAFFEDTSRESVDLYLSVVTIGASKTARENGWHFDSHLENLAGRTRLGVLGQAARLGNPIACRD
jgi:hypothetical protein